jgi:hypothetical protein
VEGFRPLERKKKKKGAFHVPLFRSKLLSSTGEARL